MLGSAFIETDRVDHGQRLIETIFKGGESAEGHLLMGSVHLRAGDAPAALIELRKAVELNPMLPVANGLLGRALLRNGEHEAALRAFLRELEINPDDYNTNLQVGELKKRDQQFDDARVYIERALRMRPDDIAARFALAGVEVSTGKNEDARQLLEGVVAAAPKYSEACALLATVYYRLQRKADGDRMRARRRGAERRSPGAAARRQAAAVISGRPSAVRYLRSLRQTSIHDPSALPTANQPTCDVRLAVAVHVADVQRGM